MSFSPIIQEFLDHCQLKSFIASQSTVTNISEETILSYMKYLHTLEVGENTHELEEWLGIPLINVLHQSAEEYVWMEMTSIAAEIYKW